MGHLEKKASQVPIITIPDSVDRVHFGQHVLVDRQVLDQIANTVSAENVLEIGPGTGNLTKYLATRADRVVGVEIDQRFKPFLDSIVDNGVEVIYDNALKQGILRRVVSTGGEWQVIGNIAYQISPDLLQILTEIHIESATLLVGQNFADICQCRDPASTDFSRTSFMANTFFEVVPLGRVDKKSFFPEPATQSQLISLLPRDKRQYRDNPGLRIARQMIDSATKGKPQSIERILLSNTDTQRSGKSNLSKSEFHRHVRRQQKQELSGLVRQRDFQSGIINTHSASTKSLETLTGLSRAELSATFRSLDNEAIRRMATYLLTIGWGEN